MKERRKMATTDSFYHEPKRNPASHGRDHGHDHEDLRCCGYDLIREHKHVIPRVDAVTAAVMETPLNTGMVTAISIPIPTGILTAADPRSVTYARNIVMPARSVWQIVLGRSPIPSTGNGHIPWSVLAVSIAQPKLLPAQNYRMSCRRRTVESQATASVMSFLRQSGAAAPMRLSRRRQKRKGGCNEKT